MTLCACDAAICTLSAPWEAFVIGCLGAIWATLAELLLRRLKVDDPVGVVPVHLVCSIWGLLSVGTDVALGSASLGSIVMNKRTLPLMYLPWC